MSATSKANYQISFPQGPLVDKSGLITGEWQKFFIWLFNRTGSGVGIDGAYLASQSDTNTSNISDLQETITEIISELQQNIIRAEQLNSCINSSIEKMESLFLVNQLKINNNENNSEDAMLLSSLHQTIKEEYENLFILLSSYQNVNSLSNIVNDNKNNQDAINANTSNDISSLTTTVNNNKTSQDATNTTLTNDISSLTTTVNNNKTNQDTINTNTSNALISLTTTVNNNKTNQDTVNTTLSNNISSLSSTVTDIEQDVSDLQNFVVLHDNNKVVSDLNNMLQQIQDYSIINLMS